MLTNSSKVLRRRERNCLHFFQSVNQLVSHSFSQSCIHSFIKPVSQSEYRAHHKCCDTLRHSIHMYNLLCNLFHFTVFSRPNKVRLGASMAQMVQRLRYGLKCPGFGSNRRRDTFPFSKTSSPAVVPSQPIFTGHRE